MHALKSLQRLLEVTDTYFTKFVSETNEISGNFFGCIDRMRIECTKRLATSNTESHYRANSKQREICSLKIM